MICTMYTRQITENVHQSRAKTTARLAFIRRPDQNTADDINYPKCFIQDLLTGVFHRVTTLLAWYQAPIQ